MSEPSSGHTGGLCVCVHVLCVCVCVCYMDRYISVLQYGMFLDVAYLSTYGSLC